MSEVGKQEPWKNFFPEDRLERFSRKYYYPFLAALGAGWMAAYPWRDEIVEKAAEVVASAQELPRLARAAIRDGASEQQVKNFLEKFQAELDTGAPLSLDLFDFYLEQEVQAGGITHEEAERARGEFEQITTFAQGLQAEEKSRNEVLGYVLKQQGAYESGSSFVADLLNEDDGNCEARIKYISAAAQRLYPEDVADGKLKIEVFGSYVNENGERVAGHVRAVLNEDRRVGVLEGGSVKWESADGHVNIPTYEATQMAVKAFAAEEGLYDFKKDKIITQEQQETRALHLDPEEQEQTSGVSFTTDSVMRFPPSTARYAEGRGTRNVDPTKVGDSWARSKDDWSHAVELELRSQLTPETVNLTFRRSRRGRRVHVALEPYGDIDLATMRALLDLRDRTFVLGDVPYPQPSLYVRGDQRLPKEAFTDESPAELIVTSPLQVEKFEEIPMKKLKLENVSVIPPGLETLAWTKDAELVIQAGETARMDSMGRLSALKNTPVRTLIFQVESIDDSNVGLLSVQPGDFDGLKLDTLEFLHITPTEIGSVEAKEIVYNPSLMAFSSPVGWLHHNVFGRVKTSKLKIELPLQRPLIGTDLFGGNVDGLRNATMDVRVAMLPKRVFQGLVLSRLNLETDTIDVQAFSEASIDTVIVRSQGGGWPQPFALQSAFEGADIKHLVLIFKASMPEETAIQGIESLRQELERDLPTGSEVILLDLKAIEEFLGTQNQYYLHHLTLEQCREIDKRGPPFTYQNPHQKPSAESHPDGGERDEQGGP
jgi:hypothetical protein